MKRTNGRIQKLYKPYHPKSDVKHQLPTEVRKLIQYTGFDAAEKRFAPAYSEIGKTLPYDVRIREACELLRLGWTQPVYAPKEAPDCTTSFISSYTGEEKRFRFHWDDSRQEDKLLITRIK
jgi:hypothetical protein